MGGGLGSEHEELGNVVGVQIAQRGFEGVEMLRGGLDEEQNFARGFDGAVPAIDRRETGQEIDARGHALLHERVGDALGFVTRAGGGEDEAGFCGGQDHMRYRVQGEGKV